MKSAIVITTINEPTEAVRRFALLDRYQVFVVGDRKTPDIWRLDGVQFYSFEEQLVDDYLLSAILPVNHYSRKMLGYLKAAEWGAENIIDTDDDNLPYADWSFPNQAGLFEHLPATDGFVNIYKWFTGKKIWPRGLPLHFASASRSMLDGLKLKEARIGVWQGLADGDPDVDAIYRLTINEPCYFDKREPIVLQEGTVCPFNSQNTLFVRELFPLLYLPAHVTFRFTDILRGLVAQPIMWLYGYKLGFVSSTVEQLRNPHDYMKDFESEFPMYLHCEKIPGIIANAVSPKDTIADNLLNAYISLINNGIVPMEELKILRAWITDIEKAQIKK